MKLAKNQRFRLSQKDFFEFWLERTFQEKYSQVARSGKQKQILREEEQKSLGKMEMLTTRKSSSFDSATNFPIITPEKDEMKRGKFILFPRPCDLRVSFLKYVDSNPTYLEDR